MAGCCDPRGCDGVFDDRFARRSAARYRKRGLDRTARRIVTLLTENGIAGASVLEVGGGIGDIQIELLRRGATHAVNLELSSAYEGQAGELLAAAGLGDKVRRYILDVAADPEQVPPADVTVLHRVVCCYPDYAALLGAVADRTRRQIVFSHPPRNALSRAIVGAENLGFRLRGSPFRVFAHPPAAMLEVLASHGLHPQRTRRAGLLWRLASATR